ncbi:hypothetical protein ES288_D07G234400v1 [Gossypium darwinii]|uniref:Uncharacterized protein n=1 Tax=Gossypium darwinii TaxID=34276 RepID=A0A5D2C2F0_GOSDA|nr:hypothetical protein ES288_D07G234400v1 [Gossypium darwinii]
MVVDSMPSRGHQQPTSEGSVQLYWNLHVRAFEAKRRRRATLSNDLKRKKKPLGKQVVTLRRQRKTDTKERSYFVEKKSKGKMIDYNGRKCEWYRP